MTSRPFLSSARLGCLAALLLASPGALRAAATAPGDAASAPANRLIHEKSPYLRQHAHNPVDWYPWGEEAFAKARRENKPIFLSIGYSTCHWCHVMERESFSDPAIARQLNEQFVCIKVDREERPDVDRVYMAFVLASTGAGGWPMSVWLTPELKPIFGGTYFPPEASAGRPGFKTVLDRIAKLWSGQRERVLQQSDQMLAALAQDLQATAGDSTLHIADLRRDGLVRTAAAFDPKFGGFEPAPKFPQPATVEFLLDLHATSPEPAKRQRALAMAVTTLRQLALGGIRDHLGGGFHRYSVDEKWHVPHFEKMLYDQAQLASVYVSAWQLTRDPFLADAARTTLDYVRLEMTDPAGGFYSAEDADSAIHDPAGRGVAIEPSPDRPTENDSPHPQHAEGAFYIWTATEIEAALGASDAALFAFAYGVEPNGNVTTGEPAEFAGRNILFRAQDDAACAARFALSPDTVRDRLTAARTKLVAARALRPRPLRDDKVITAWNGLMISAFARAAQAFDEPAYAEAAARAATFLRQHLFDPATGQLARSHRAGATDAHGFSEDYAALIQGLLDLYETTFETTWLEWAVQLQEKHLALFWDPAGGGFFADTGNDPSVVLRLKEDNDGAEPSSNSLAVRNLARLAELLHRDDWKALAGRTALAFNPQLERAPTSLAQMLVSLGWLEGTPKQILIHGEPADLHTAAFVAEVHAHFLPRRVVARIDTASRPFFAARVPLIADLPESTSGRATAYVCENFVCQLPTQELATFHKLLGLPPAP